jgi:hypothetical protein
MQEQKMFAPPPDLGRQGLLQIARPTETEIGTAAALMMAICDRFSTAHTGPALT